MVAGLYFLLLVIVALGVLGWMLSFSSGIWLAIAGGVLLLGEVGICGWFAYQNIVPEIMGGMRMNEKNVEANEESCNVQETTEERICRRLSELFDEQHIYREFELHVEDVAMRIGTNRTYLSAVLNKKYGSNFLKFVNQYRLNEACELLKSTSWPICRIADRVGYRNLNTFNSCFRERFGLPPKQWRLNNNEDV